MKSDAVNFREAMMCPCMVSKLHSSFGACLKILFWQMAASFCWRNFRRLCWHIWVTSCPSRVCLQYLCLLSWAACMLVFGFVGDLLATTTTGLLLVARQRLLTPGKLATLHRGSSYKGKWSLSSTFTFDFGFTPFGPTHSSLFNARVQLTQFGLPWLLSFHCW